MQNNKTMNMLHSIVLNWVRASIPASRIDGIMVSVLASSAVDRGFEPQSGQTKDFNIGICCFSAKHAALRRKSKYWLARTQNNVSEWSDMSHRGLLFQWASTMKIQLVLSISLDIQNRISQGYFRGTWTLK